MSDSIFYVFNIKNRCITTYLYHQIIYRVSFRIFGKGEGKCRVGAEEGGHARRACASPRGGSQIPRGGKCPPPPPLKETPIYIAGQM